MTGPILGVGVVGCGDRSPHHLASWSKLPNTRLVATCDLIEGLASSAAETYGAEAWYTDYRELIARDDIDIVDVITPAHVHAAPTILALESGKHVLCEKPIASTIQDANAMVETARRTGRRLMINENTIFHPTYQKVKEIIDTGVLGDLVMLYHSSITMLHYHIMHEWMFDSLRSGGPIVDFDIHQFHPFVWWMGKVESVYAQTRVVPIYVSLDRLRYETEQYERATHPAVNNACITLRFKSGAIGQITESYSAFVTTRQTGILGTEGSIRIEGDQILLRTQDMGPKAEPEVISLPPPADYRRMGQIPHTWWLQYRDDPFPPFHDPEKSPEAKWALESEPMTTIKHFADCISEGRPHLATGEEGRDALEIAMAAFKSGVTGEVVTLPMV